MSFNRKYKESLDLIDKLESILYLKKLEKSKKKNSNKEELEKEKKELSEMLKEDDNPKDKITEDLFEQEDSISPKELSDHEKMIDDLMKDKDSLSDSDIERRINDIAESAPEGWEPSDQLREFYKDFSKNKHLSMDLNTVGSLFLGVDKSTIESVRMMSMSGYGFFTGLLKKIYPDEYYGTVDDLFEKVYETIPKKYMSLYMKKFTEHAGGGKALTEKIIQIGTKEGYEEDIVYSDGTIKMGDDHAFDARVSILKSMALALTDVGMVSIGLGSEEDEKYVNSNYQFPLRNYNRISSEYGMRNHPRYKDNRMHYGLDISAPTGTNIYPISKGVVSKVGYSSGRGNWIEVDHEDGYSSRYLHCKAIYSNKGDIVGFNSIIASVGSTGVSTGPHLHLEIREGGKTIDPMEIMQELI